MRVVVTGSCGSYGRYVLNSLVREGRTVLCLDIRELGNSSAGILSMGLGTSGKRILTHDLIDSNRTLAITCDFRADCIVHGAP
jgi:nucleoside-diphosphate-sugar epimerase